MLRKIRIILASIFFIGITLLFLDFTGVLHTWLGWMAKIQLLPAVLALNLAVIAALAILTLLFGRLYCSVICPMGVMQDVISWIHKKSNKKARFRFTYSPAKNWLRYLVLAMFVIGLVLGANSIVLLVAPYSAYGRIAANIFAPLYQLGNNVLAYFAERADSYAFYKVDVWIKAASSLAIAAITFVVVGFLAWKHGRTWCNTICPVGTVLGFLSRFSFFAPVIDTEKCRNCGLCSKQCKASCIDMDNHKIDYSRCVVCMDCIDTCKDGAIRYEKRVKSHCSAAADNDVQGNDVNKGRRAFITTSVIAGTAATMKAQEMKVDGGLAEISRAQKPQRKTPLVPAGSLSLKNFSNHCVSCQLCVAACPNQVLRPSTALETLMQPEMSYERGYCRPECTTCSQICPAGAIRPIGIEEKSSIQIGHAVINLEACVVNKDNVSCGNCARHCPAGAIRMVKKNPDDENSIRIPVVNEEKCIGCGACENLCPARPFTAIHVEGHEVHKEL
jgi:formate hydrogenlyase subunit 6/NADH:ubiquinone oxidoreductase subunit I